MVRLNERYIMDKDGNRVEVVLSIREWEGLLAELEELSDVRAYDKSKAGDNPSVPFDDAVSELERRRSA